jgi:small GTP-binding protein
MDIVFENVPEYDKHINILFAGEEGVGKSSLINTILKKNKAPVSDMHTKTWQLTRYSINVNELVLNLFDIPGIEGKYSDETIGEELKGYRFDIIVCCLDGTRIRPNGMVRKSISFIKKYLSNIPVLFVVTKENTLLLETNRINEVKSSVRENANQHFKHFGLASVGDNLPFIRTHTFWQEMITCIPQFEKVVTINFMKYEKDEDNILMNLQEYITINYKSIPEIEQRLRVKEYIIKNMKLVFGFFSYLYVILCTITLVSGVTCDFFHIAQACAIFFILVLVVLKIVIWMYSTNKYGIFPISIDNLETDTGIFSGIINYVSKDKFYTRLNGIITLNNSVHTVNLNNETCCAFELCDHKFFNKYSEIMNV